MKNTEILRRAENHLKAVDSLLSQLEKRHTRKAMTHAQAVKLEEVEQHCSDIKTSIGDIWDVPDPDAKPKPKKREFCGTGFDPEPTHR